MFVLDNRHTIGALESFLHDVRVGESNLEEELFSVVGYNELKYLVKMAKVGE